MKRKKLKEQVLQGANDEVFTRKKEEKLISFLILPHTHSPIAGHDSQEKTPPHFSARLQFSPVTSLGEKPFKTHCCCGFWCFSSALVVGFFVCLFFVFVFSSGCSFPVVLFLLFLLEDKKLVASDDSLFTRSYFVFVSVLSFSCSFCSGFTLFHLPFFAALLLFFFCCLVFVVLLLVFMRMI